MKNSPATPVPLESVGMVQPTVEFPTSESSTQYLVFAVTAHPQNTCSGVGLKFKSESDSGPVVPKTDPGTPKLSDRKLI